MATIKHSSSHKVNRLINYCEKRADVTSSHNLIAEDRKSVQKQMAMTRELFDKTGGVEGHHFIQSFKPGEVTSEKANELGLELVKRMHPDREAVVYTHTDKGHIHNHIVLNSPSIDNGKKLSVTKKHYYDWQRENDGVCKENGLSIVTEKQKNKNKSLAEHHLLSRGEISFKEYLRQTIDKVREKALNFREMQDSLKEKWFVESKSQNGLYYFKTPDMNRFMSGRTLGSNYSREAIEDGFRSNARAYEERQREQQQRERERREQAEREKRQRELEQSRRVNDQSRTDVGLDANGNQRTKPADERFKSRQPESSRERTPESKTISRETDKGSRENQRSLSKDLGGARENKSSGFDNGQGKDRSHSFSDKADRNARTRDSSKGSRDVGPEL